MQPGVQLPLGEIGGGGRGAGEGEVAGAWISSECGGEASLRAGGCPGACDWLAVTAATGTGAYDGEVAALVVC